MISKLFKWKKLIVCIVIILGIAFYFVANTHSIDANVQINSIKTGLPTNIHSEQIIDKRMVIESLGKAGKLVSLDGHVTKHYQQVDSLFQDHNWIKDVIGSRSVEMDVNAYFKMGVDLNNIKPEDIEIYGQTIFITLSKPELVSLSIPYDELTTKSVHGIFRGNMTEEQKQLMYTEIRKLLTDNIMSDKGIMDKSMTNAQECLKGLLSKIPNCNRIMFKVSNT